MTISDQIQAQADESAKALRAQGWEGGGHSYDIGTYHGDAEALAERLGRPTTRDERVSPETTEVQEGYDALGRTLRRFGIRPLPWHIRDMGRNPQRSPR